jgi:HK97 family phage prohead protease
MEHLLLKAATTATDEGTFEAVIVEPTAIAKALSKWAALGKLMPLAYSHRDPATGQAVVVGHIVPDSVRVEGKEVISKGWVDQATERGAETWRLVKSGTLSFSYGYLIPKGGATKRLGKNTGLHITEIDLYEVSVVPVGPANNDTRVLSFKAMGPDRVAERVRAQGAPRGSFRGPVEEAGGSRGARVRVGRPELVEATQNG